MNTLRKFRNILLLIIDWFYKPFARFINIDTFRYAFCGGMNTTLDIFLYFIFYNFVLYKHAVDLHIFTMAPHIAAFFMVFPITFSTGFMLSKFVTFRESELHGRIQLFRYGVTVLVCIVLNYIFLKLFVEQFHWYPTVSKAVATVIIAIYSYLSQKHYTFRQAVKWFWMSSV